MDIETPRLLLIESYQVVPEHITWLNDRSLMKWSEQQFTQHTYTTQADFLHHAKWSKSPLVFDIRLKPDIDHWPDRSDNNRIKPLISDGAYHTIGSLHAHIDYQHKRADLGIMLGPKFHGKGFAHEAWRGLEGYLFCKLDMRKLEAGCALKNMPMRNLLHKSGWSLEGNRMDHFEYDGERHPLLLWGKVHP